jgi:hypothetical protein
MEEAIRNGTAGLRNELVQLYDTAWNHATEDERVYLPVIRSRIEHGSLAELIRDRFLKEGEIVPLLGDMAKCLRSNTPYNLA